ncbi:MAG TPA: histidine kinase dimerization/phospho-acceptor domain-containing protein [Longimicrobiales bacterium]|nr:histidine kinase dimerization/phospho-acceptor domain-containing protein [Longimicrobiales bacterium]
MDESPTDEFVKRVRTVRHDASNPLTAALGHVQLLLDDPDIQDERVLATLRTIEGELRRLVTILNGLTAARGGADERGPEADPAGVGPP